MREANIDIEVLADEAEGLRAIEDALHEYDRAHPGCPRCGVRQYSATSILCRKCGLNFRKAG
jgi:tRNA(Ile2) C34 agmatinyltransferase TiaS